MISRTLRWAAVLAVFLSSACAGIPSSGPVTKVEDDVGLGESTVRYSPAGPVEGGSPEQIVRGFLDAMLAYPMATRTAAAFLEPTSADEWNPAAGVSIYSRPQVGARTPTTKGLNDPSDARGSVQVRLDFVLDAELDRQGHYTRRAAPDAVTFTLRRAAGQWRIVDPPDGLMVNAKFFADYARPFNLYYFDRPGRRLVPDPVYVVVGDQLAASLVTSLARGPGESLAATSRTFLPQSSVLRPSVPVSDNGVAEIEFTSDLDGLTDGVRERLSAQIVWTLRQVPSIDAVQIVGDGVPLSAGRREIQSISSWGGFGPRIDRGRAYAVADGRVVEIAGGEVKRLDGAWGKDARGASAVAVSSDGVAGVLSGRRQVRVTALDGSGARTMSGTDFIVPRWDGDAVLWLVDTDGGRTRVRIDDSGEVRRIEAEGLELLDVVTFALSPDGTRYAVGVRRGTDREIRVGAVRRDARDRILGLSAPAEVFTSADRPRSVAWSSGTELRFLADGPAGPQVHQAAIDGSVTTDDPDGRGALLPKVGIRALAVGTGEDADEYASDAKGRLWFRPADGSWQQVKTEPVTGLTYGR